MGISRKLISNAVYLFLDWSLISLFSFIFWVMLGKVLLPSEYGVVVTSINFILLMLSFSTLGIALALYKLVPEIMKKKGIKGVYSLVRLSIKPVIIFLSFLSLLLFIFSSLLVTYLKIPYGIMLICIISIFPITMFSFFGMILHGLQDMRKLFLTDFFQVLIRLIVSGVLLFLGFRYLGPLIAFFLGYFLICFLRIDLNYFKDDKSPISYKKIFYYSIPALIASISGYVIISSQYIILTILKTTEVTGVFAVAAIITSVIGILTNVLTSAAFPIISGLSADRRTKVRQSYLIALVVRYSLLFVSPLSILLIIFSKYAILLFSSSQYLSAAAYFPILVPAAVLTGMGGIFYTNIYAIGKPNTERNIMVASALLFLVTSIFLTKYFSAIGLSFAQLITASLLFSLSFIYIRKYLRFKFFVSDTLKILFSTFIVVSVLLILRQFILSIFTLALIIVPVGLLYLIVLLFVNFYRTEDIVILEYLGEKIPVIGKYLLAIANFIRRRIS